MASVSLASFHVCVFVSVERHGDSSSSSSDDEDELSSMLDKKASLIGPSPQVGQGDDVKGAASAAAVASPSRAAVDIQELRKQLAQMGAGL